MEPELERNGLRYRVQPDVYDPHDDTWLLVDALRVGRGERVLDLGCGAGLVGIAAARQGARVVASDVNPRALRLARENARLNHVQVHHVRTDLLWGFRTGIFDLVAFNPPYLPTAPDERVPGPLNAALDGGETGRDVVDRLVGQVWHWVGTRFWIVESSLQAPPTLLERAKAAKATGRTVAGKKLSFESLTVMELSTIQEGETDHEPARR